MEIRMVHKRTEATKYDRLALRIEQYIKYYTPAGFREPIRVFDYTPFLVKSNARNMVKYFIEGSLEKHLKNPASFPHTKISEKWYFQEAILKFFEQGKHNVSD